MSIDLPRRLASPRECPKFTVLFIDTARRCFVAWLTTIVLSVCGNLSPVWLSKVSSARYPGLGIAGLPLCLLLGKQH